MKVVWVQAAERAYLDYLRYLSQVAPQVAPEVQSETELAIQLLAEHPLAGRSSRWKGLREWGLVRWRKIMVYRVEEDRLVIVAFYDGRQDLTKVRPKG